jgi:hypothetical protein
MIRLPALLDAAGALGLPLAGALVAFQTAALHPIDADMLWRTGHAATYYGTTWGADAASRFVYPPVLAQLVGLLPADAWLPFFVVLEVLLFTAFWLVLRWLAIPVVVIGVGAGAVGMSYSPATSPVISLVNGNIQALLLAAIVVGLRSPAAWAFVLLTKIGPGVGIVWFVARREWRHLATALGVTSAVVIVSAVAAPDAWRGWLQFAWANAAAPSPEQPFLPVPLWLRLPLVVVTIAWAAHTDRAWVVPGAAAFGSLALYQWSWVISVLVSFSMWTRSRGALAKDEPPRPREDTRPRRGVRRYGDL